MSNNKPKRLMLMFTIGPVQSFIEAARKTEDLWMGSYILSYLVANAIDKVRGGDVELIYPAIGSQSPFDFWKQQDFATPSFPNLFLAVGSGIEVSQDELVNRAKAAENSVKDEFEHMAECAIDKAFGRNKWRGTYVEKVFKRQVSNFFDVYWVITEEIQNYGNWYVHTAGSLASIKNCRTFTQNSEFGRKCSLDGTREILHLRQDDPVRKAMNWWQNFAKREPKYCRGEEQAEKQRREKEEAERQRETERLANVSPVEQLVEELNRLTESQVDEARVTAIYSKELPVLAGDEELMIARALKAYWQRINKWEGGSKKQRAKVKKVKSILGLTSMR